MVAVRVNLICGALYLLYLPQFGEQYLLTLVIALLSRSGNQTSRGTNVPKRWFTSVYQNLDTIVSVKVFLKYRQSTVYSALKFYFKAS